MKLIMTLLVKDEVDIIAANIDFHLNSGVDALIITDNASTDGTRDLLATYALWSEVTVIDEPAQDYSQHRWVTRMALAAANEMAADWIINSDADEFWTHPDTCLKDALAEAHAAQQVCHRRNMVYPFDAESAAPWYERLIYRAEQSVAPPRLNDPLRDPLPMPYFTLDLPPKVAVKGKGLVSIGQGNHRAKFEGKAESEGSELLIYHFPARSTAQLKSKVVNGGRAYMRNTEFPETVGWHWRRLYRILTEEGAAAMLADALPDKKWIDQRLSSGEVVCDRTLAPALSALHRGG